jgi:hypothetical protein
MAVKVKLGANRHPFLWKLLRFVLIVVVAVAMASSRTTITTTRAW